jgi:hypothetical protein
VPGKAPNGILSYDMRSVNFKKSGVYPIQITLAGGTRVSASLGVGVNPNDSCYYVQSTNADVDPKFCVNRSKAGLTWFSDLVFSQLVGATSADDALKLSMVEFQ